MMPFWDKRIPESLAFKDYANLQPNDSRRVARAEGDNSDQVYVEQACHFLQRERGFSRPFMMVVNLEKPHTPYAVSEPWYSMYDRSQITPFPRDLPAGAPLSLRAQVEVRGNNLSDEQLRDIQAVYYGMISQVDRQVGQLLQTIDELQLWDNSIILFLSDHGDWASQFKLTEKWDTSFNDCMVKIPFILHAPSIAGGRRINGLSEMVDVAPTVLSLMGTKPHWSVHGIDLTAAINGGNTKDAVYATGGHERVARERFQAMHGSSPIRINGLLLDKQETYRRFPDSMARARMIRTQSHKMVIRETGDHELYDLRNDPWELQNLWGQKGTEGIIQELQLMMLMENLRTDPDQPPLARVGA